MTSHEFIQAAKAYWSGKNGVLGGASEEKIEDFRRKLEKYPEMSYPSILEYLKDNCKFFPERPDLIKATEHLLLQHEERREKYINPDCICKGTGWVAVWLSDEGKIIQVRDQEENFTWKEGVARCWCPGGDGKPDHIKRVSYGGSDGKTGY